MKPAEVLELLQAFYRDKLASRLQHEARARYVSKYEFNNTYQFIIAREDMQLEWLQAAIAGMGGEPPEVAVTPFVPEGNGAARGEAILRQDVADLQAFHDRWTSRVETLAHARHRLMLRVILGEVVEHRRLLEQALQGRIDVLGRGERGREAAGRVLPERWIE